VGVSPREADLQSRGHSRGESAGRDWKGRWGRGVCGAMVGEGVSGGVDVGLSEGGGGKLGYPLR